MMIRKGPYGHFAVEEISDPASISEYAMRIIVSGEARHLLPVYVNRSWDLYELAFDFSGMMPVSDFDNGKNTAQQLDKRRKSAGDLFLSIHHLIDMLINPSLICMDPKYVFTDPEGSDICICCLPKKTATPNKLSSVDPHNMETLLRSRFFQDVLSEDEITRLVYSVENNDEEMFVSTSSSILNNPIGKDLPDAFNYDLLYILILSAASLITTFMNTSLSLILAAAAVLFLMTVLRGARKKVTSDEDNDQNDKSLILFEDSGKHGLNCAFLESIKPVDGSVIRYGVYQDLTTIGSDRFLSDLYINSAHVSPIHAQLTLTEDTVYLSDCSSDGSTYIDDRKITPEVKHEVKNGQKITFGDVDFSLTISL